MQKTYGRDVTRFLTGSYHLEEYAELPAYAHSKQAYAILEQYRFGSIEDREYSIVKKGFEQSIKQTDPDHHHDTNASYINESQGIELQETFVGSNSNQQ